MQKFHKLIEQSLKKDQLETLLKTLLTDQELEKITERINILELLMQNKTQRQIAKELGISITTVTRGNKILEENQEIKSYFNTSDSIHPKST